MSSVVFYKFINEKDPSRISFDGTGISVFELKRDIIKEAKLGDGTDFDLVLYHQGTREEYSDDTTIVPRSSLVEAKRVRATKPGQGRAARYVSGKMPTIARNAYRTESSAQPRNDSTINGSTPAVAAYDETLTEEERIAAMMKAGNTQWEQEKQKMASQTPVFFKHSGPKPAAVPTPENNKPPPLGYLCHRCLQKGHYIQNCPTNGDPNFDNRRRVKRITGIPKSLMQTVDEDEVEEDDGDGDDKKPATIMVNVDGKRVRAVPDQASWAQYTAKNEASAAKKEDVSQGSEELRERGLECAIDKRLFANPVKTPCCSKTYCFDCIESTLLDTDLVCPGCGTEGVLLDNLETDADMNAKIRAYEDEKRAQSQPKTEAPKSPPKSVEEDGKEGAQDAVRDESTSDVKLPNQSEAQRSPTPRKSPTPCTANPKKRVAEEELPNNREGSAPAAPEMQKSRSQTSEPKSPRSSTNNNSVPMNAPTGPAADRNKISNMAGNMNFPMGMMNPMMMNPMMMGGFMNFPNQFNGMNGMSGMSGMTGMGNMGGMGGMGGMSGMGMNGMNSMNMPQMNNGNWQQGQTQTNVNNGIPSGPRAQQTGFKGGAGMNAHPNFNADGPYQRNPVNPHRQNRQRKVRQADYKEL